MSKKLKHLIQQSELRCKEVINVFKEEETKFTNLYSKINNKIMNYSSVICNKEYNILKNYFDESYDNHNNSISLKIKSEFSGENSERENVNNSWNNFNKCVDKNLGINKSILLFEANNQKTSHALSDCIRHCNKTSDDNTKLDECFDKCTNRHYQELITIYSEIHSKFKLIEQKLI